MKAQELTLLWATRPFCVRLSIATRTGMQRLLNSSLWRSKYTTTDKCLDLCLFLHFMHCQYIPAHLSIGILLLSRLLCVSVAVSVPYSLLIHYQGKKKWSIPDSSNPILIEKWPFTHTWKKLFRETISNIHSICSKASICSQISVLQNTEG